MAQLPYVEPKVAITDLTADGFGVGRTTQDVVVFVQGAVPGDVVDARVYRKERRLLRAEVEQLLIPSPNRVSPVCAHFGACGGCKLQQLDYKAQLEFKNRMVVEAYKRIGKMELPEMAPILAAPKPYQYRNKLEFTFAQRRWLTREQLTHTTLKKEEGLGFHVSGAFDKVLHLDECHLMPTEVNKIRNAAFRIALEHKLTFRDPKSNIGQLRNLIIRCSQDGKQWLVLLVLGENEPDLIMPYLEALFVACPPNTGLHWLVNEKRNDNYQNLPLRSFRGPLNLEETLGALKFQISPLSFFQTNPRQCENLYAAIKSRLPDKPISLLVDLFCGTGTIGLYCSDKAEKVVGLEYVESAVADAKQNAKRNGITNADFRVVNLAKDVSVELENLLSTANVIIVDPPRAGLEASLVKNLLKWAPKEIIYVSCNPTTQARDVKLLNSHYNLVYLQPVDMFPQTSHVESIAHLRIISA